VLIGAVGTGLETGLLVLLHVFLAFLALFLLLVALAALFPAASLVTRFGGFGVCFGGAAPESADSVFLDSVTNPAVLTVPEKSTQNSRRAKRAYCRRSKNKSISGVLTTHST
jgi:hypothetical protein